MAQIILLSNFYNFPSPSYLSIYLGYHDFKHLMYGDESSGPLSLSLQMEHEGNLRIMIIMINLHHI